ncbi:MAG TPA: protein kinase, partial [Blastocatellia bacterium]|nr:protein kinase [Blastocatellia bacterium]
MNPQLQPQWPEIERIFDEALECEDNERAAFLEAACAGDELLRREVEALLAADQKLQQAPRLLASPLHRTKATPTRLGAYQLQHEIARGGMGAVWLAHRADEQFEQQVAIKLLRAGANHDDLQRRFQHERQILADLNHPNIARLLDGGTTAEGQPYFVMEYIEGVPIDEYCQQQQLSVRDRLLLFRQVCAAVQYAHQHLIIHRDLKPANILVTADGTPKLLDFGIAKLLQPDLSQSHQTQAGQTPMTPAYASPEQVRGEKLTTASDVYSLGVLLYELLTGRSPYRLKENTLGEMMRVIVEQEPERPSLLVSQYTAEIKRTTKSAEESLETRKSSLPESPDKLRRHLTGDLDAIVLKALRKEPESRYISIEQFSADLRAYLEGMPVAARRGTFNYRAVRFIRRNKVPVAAAAVVVLSLLGGIGASMYQARIARTAQAHAEGQELSNRRLLYTSQMRLAQSAWDNANVERVRELLTAHIPQAGQPDLRGFEWNYLWKLSHTELAALPHAAEVTSVAFTPDGSSLISVVELPNKPRTLRIWDTTAWQEKYQATGDYPSDIGREIAIAKNSQYFAIGGFSMGIDLRDTITGKRIKKIAESVSFLSMALSPDGTRVAGGLYDGSVAIYDVLTGQEISRFHAHNRLIGEMTFSPDGQKLVTKGDKNVSLKLWDVPSGKKLWSLPLRMIYRNPLFLSDGHYLVSAGEFSLAVIDVNAGKEIRQIKLQERGSSLSLSPDGKILAIGQFDRHVTLWDTETWQMLPAIKGHQVTALAFAPDGKTLASGSGDGIVKLWDINQSLSVDTYQLKKSYVDEMGFAPTVGRLLIMDAEQSLHAFDTSTKQKLFTIESRSGLFSDLWNTSRFKHLFTQTNDGSRIAVPHEQTIRILDAATGSELLNVPTPGLYSYAINLSSDGRMMAANLCSCRAPDINTDATLENDFDHLIVWETATGHQLLNIDKPEVPLSRTVFLKDNQTIVSGGMTGHLVWWDLATRKQKKVLDTGANGSSLTLSPDGKLLAVADKIAAVLLFDSTTGEKILTLKGHNSFVRRMAFSPDSKRLLTGATDQTARLWDLRTGQELL